MTIEEFNKLTNEIPNFAVYMNDIETLSQLEVRVEDLGKEVRRLYDNLNKVNDSSIPEDQKEVFRKSAEPTYNDKKNKLQVLFQIQEHYNKYLRTFRAMMELEKDETLSAEDK